MKIGIVQLSDIHFRKETDHIIKKLDLLSSSIAAALIECNKLFIVVTGDISDTGENYQIAKSFFTDLKEGIKSKFGKNFLNSIDFIFIPGNHDCFLPENDEIRQIVIDNFKKNDEPSDNIINQLLLSQNKFWDFYEDFLNVKQQQKISYIESYKLKADLDLNFYCYNTSWMSQRKEKPGDSIFPISKLLRNDMVGKKRIDISIHHHPASWLSPSTPLNNKKTFIRHLKDTSNIILCGHEHEASAEIVKEFEGSLETFYFECKALQTNKENESGFNTILINLDDSSCNFKNHIFKNDLFIIEAEKPFIMDGTTKQILYQSEDFLREIRKIPIPLKHKDKLELELFDLFVFPDLEPILNDEEKVSQYHSSEQVLFENENEKILIEGASQSGKTSLLNKYFVDLYNLGYFPLYLNGKNVKSEDAEAFLKKALKEQYAKVENQWDKFSQIKIGKRYVLIDSFDQCPLNEKAKNIFLKKIERYFEKIVITVSEENEIHAISENEKIYNSYKNYKILPLGRVKRNEIIEKWLLLGKDISNMNDEELSHAIKSSFDSVNDLLGEQLIPSYPIFILTLLQSLENAIQPFNIAPTSYAYCYQSLIHVGLTKAGVDQKDIGSLFNFLSELSYDLYSNKIKKIAEDKIELFYADYIKDFIIKYNLKDLLEILIKSTILIKEDNYYYFSYKYISFYLTAKYISKDIGDEKTQREISTLCANLESEDSANILIFLTHHTHQNFLLDEILIASMMPFEKVQPITLEVDDPFFKFLNEFIKEVKTEVIPAVSNHKANRIKNLEKQDKRDHKFNKFKNKKDNIEELPEEIKEFMRVFKIIRILGQITKNQQGNFKREKLLELLKAAYVVCFRSINFVSEIIQNEKENIVQKILEEKDQDKEHLKNKINQILFNLGYKVCLQSFSNLCMAVGASNMDEIYDEVAKDIKTPAAKLITFSIKSYYGKLNVSELEFLFEEFKGNPVTTDILRARVKSYLYQHKVDYKKEQKISSICNFKIDQSKKLIEKSKNR